MVEVIENIVKEQQEKEQQENFDLKIGLHQKLNVVIKRDKPKIDLIDFLCSSCGALKNITWMITVNNNHFTTWSGFTAKRIQLHLHVSLSTEKGHLQQEYHQQSTKNKLSSITYIEDMFPKSNKPDIKTHQVFFFLTSQK